MYPIHNTHWCINTVLLFQRSHWCSFLLLFLRHCCQFCQWSHQQESASRADCGTHAWGHGGKYEVSISLSIVCNVVTVAPRASSLLCPATVSPKENRCRQRNLLAWAMSLWNAVDPRLEIPAIMLILGRWQRTLSLRLSASLSRPPLCSMKQKKLPHF